MEMKIQTVPIGKFIMINCNWKARNISNIQLKFKPNGKKKKAKVGRKDKVKK